MKNLIALAFLTLLTAATFAGQKTASQTFGSVHFNATLKNNIANIGMAEVIVYKNNTFESFEKTNILGKFNYELEDNSNYLLIFRKKGYTDKIICVNTCSRTGLDASGNYTASFTLSKEKEQTGCIAQIETIDLMTNLEYSLIIPERDITTLDAMYTMIASAFKANTFITQE